MADLNQFELVIDQLEKMKTIFSAIGAFTVAFCISQSIASNLEVSDPDKPPTNLLGLPTELLVNIFKNLNLSDAVSVAKTNPHIREVVGYYVIRQLISDRPLDVIDSSETDNNQNYIGFLQNYIEFQTVLDLFKYLGRYVTKLNIHNDHPANQTQHDILYEYINKYGAKWLKEINFIRPNWAYNIPYSPLNGLEGPFPNVENLHIDGGTLGPETNLSKAFPSIRSLDIGRIGVIEQHLTEHFPSLEDLAVPQGYVHYPSYNEKFKKILELNPQLKHLTIRSCGWNGLQLVNKNRPNLINLEIDRLYLLADVNMTVPIRFGNMKTFKCKELSVSGSAYQSIQQIPLEFGNLEEFQFSHGFFSNHWINIAMKNRNLKKIITDMPLDDQQLEQIADGLEKLEELSMNSYTVDPIERVIQFIEKAKQLKKLSLFSVDPNVCQEIAKHISYEWKYVVIDQSACSLVRIY